MFCHCLFLIYPVKGLLLIVAFTDDVFYMFSLLPVVSAVGIFYLLSAVFLYEL